MRVREEIPSRPLSGRTPRTLAGASAALLGVAATVGSPEGSVLAAIVAAALALAPAVAGRGRIRLVGAVLVVLSLALAASRLGDARRSMGAWRERAEERARQGKP